jgi:hypothetical protein
VEFDSCITCATPDKCKSALAIAGAFLASRVEVCQDSYDQGMSADAAFGNPLDAEDINSDMDEIQSFFANVGCSNSQAEIRYLVQQAVDVADEILPS